MSGEVTSKHYNLLALWSCILVTMYTMIVYNTWEYNQDMQDPVLYQPSMEYRINPAVLCTDTLFQQPYEGVCTNSWFRQYFSTCGKFPDVGKWSNISRNNMEYAKFSTPLCHVQDVSGETLSAHLTSNAVKRFLMVGDSHGFRYFTALRKLVLASGYDCQVVIRENGKVKGHDMRYYISTVWAVTPQALRKKSRGCASCVSTLLRCTPKKHGQPLEMEFLGMVISSNYILPNQRFCKNSASNETYSKLCAAKSEKELLFKYYMQTRKPDVVIISTTSSHDFKKRTNTVEKIVPYYRELKSLVDALQPQVTMWITTVSQRHVAGDLFTKKIQEFNKALFSLLKTEVTGTVKSPLTIIGFDHISMSRPLNGITWSKDTIHYHPVFYSEAMMQLLNLWVSALKPGWTDEPVDYLH